jgi:hypothetical protein
MPGLAAGCQTVKRPRDLLPVLVLGGLFLLFGLAYLAFPAIEGMVNHSDCVASGRTNC